MKTWWEKDWIWLVLFVGIWIGGMLLIGFKNGWS